MLIEICFRQITYRVYSLYYYASSPLIYLSCGTESVPIYACTGRSEGFII